MFSDYRGIPRQAKLLIYLSFIPNVAIGFLYTDLVYFLVQFKGIAPTPAGLVITVIGATLAIEGIPMGILADRFGRRRLLVLGNLCASLSLIGFALTSNLILILMVAILQGTGEAAYAVSVFALLAEKATNEKRTPAFSLLNSLGWIASALGSAAISSVNLFENIGLDLGQAHVLLFVVVGLLNLLVTVLILLGVSEGTTYERTEGILPRKSGGVLVRFLVYSTLIALGAGLFVNSMTFWFLAAYGVPDSVSGPVLGLMSLLTAGVVFMSPRLARRFGLVKATVMTQGPAILLMVAVPLSPTFAISATFYILRFFLSNLSGPLTQSLLMGLVAPEERGKAAGITASFIRLPNGMSTTVGMTLIGQGLLALPFYIAAVIYVVAIGFFWVLFRNARVPEELVKESQVSVQSSSFEGPVTER